MKHGGKREGSGRKQGALSIRARDIAIEAIEAGITPLEVLLQAMRKAWDQGDIESATVYAKDAAPYVHPRLASMEMATEVTHNYVMRTPEVAVTVDEWKSKHPQVTLQ